MKLIEFFEDGRLELYNLRDDIGEARDLAAQDPDRAKALQARLAKWRQETGARMPTANSEFDPVRATRQVIRRVEVDFPILDRPS
jgi:hypothetical protein